MCTKSVLNRILEQRSEHKQTAYPFPQIHQNEYLCYISSWENFQVEHMTMFQDTDGNTSLLKQSPLICLYCFTCKTHVVLGGTV